MAWINSGEAKPIQSNYNMINLIIFLDLIHQLYGLSYNRLKPNIFLEALEQVIESSDGPFLVIGDFNYILSSEDKSSGGIFSSSSLGYFGA